MGEAQPGDFDRYYRDHFARVARAAYLVVGSREEAFDVAQESFARTWRDWARIGRRSEPLFFTLRVARNLSISRIRHLRGLARISALSGDPVEIPLEQVDVRVTVRAAVRRLPGKQRWALALCDLLDVSTEDAARILRIAPSTLRVHLARARARLRTALGPDARASSSSIEETKR